MGLLSRASSAARAARRAAAPCSCSARRPAPLPAAVAMLCFRLERLAATFPGGARRFPSDLLDDDWLAPSTPARGRICVDLARGSESNQVLKSWTRTHRLN
jgi:hypothetical protein